MLAIAARSARDGGISTEQAVILAKKDFNKDCKEEVAEAIYKTLALQGLVWFTLNKIWSCTPTGLETYQDIETNRPHLLEKTTSPNLKMRA
jgi:hypothetical protein